MDEQKTARIVDEFMAVLLSHEGEDHTPVVAALMIVAAQALAALSGPELVAHMEAFIMVLNDTLADNDARKALQAAQEAIRKAAA